MIGKKKKKKKVERVKKIFTIVHHLKLKMSELSTRFPRLTTHLFSHPPTQLGQEPHPQHKDDDDDDDDATLNEVGLENKVNNGMGNLTRNEAD